ncbi:type III secretion system protein [Vibrio sp. 10N.222.52.B12]|uniref:type III secretion system cytoplasmic ring protein SctQ n=1 Tax=Vibrio sp. 10N.222.52.B12 TaxID=1880840 RepID=UPI000C85B059|nr:type III secretion system cytoplasmic ring protein SctQ [Vibrio sp. 10N.222.52.B12]PMO42399.1 type III secretion system protein [Vibrio sp. 10N.222.52.B12]
MILDFPKVEPSSIALSNQLCAKQCHFQDSQSNSLSATLGQKPEFSGYRLTLLIGGQTIQIDFSGAQLQQWLHGILDSTAFESLPNSLQLALLSSQIEPYTDVIKRLFGQLPVLSKLQVHEQPTPEENVLMLTINRDDVSLSLWVHEGRDVLIDTLPQATSYLSQNIALPFWLSFGKTRLALSQFEQLTLGDVVFFDDCYIAQHQVLLQVSNQNLWRCQLDNTTLHIQKKETNMNDINSSEALTDHQQLAIELTFDVGQQTITLEQLNALQPGFTFELNQPISNPVTMRANGKIIGECELVNINERLGVRVLELFGGSQEPA